MNRPANSPTAYLADYLIFTTISVILLFVLFNLIWLDDKFVGRFTWFVVLCLVPAVLVTTISSSSSYRIMLVGLLFIAEPLRESLRLGSPSGALAGHLSDENLCRPNDSIRRDIVYQASARSGPYRIVPPPCYPWLAEAMRTDVKQKR